MASLVDDAIVLRCWEFSETSQTVAMLCRSHGMLRGLGKGSRRERAPFSGGFEPGTRGQIVAIVKPSTELATLTEWDLRRVYWASRRSWMGHRAVLCLLDSVRHAVTDADPHPALFDALDAALGGMESVGTPEGVLGWLLAGQWALLVETGYRPRLRSGANGAVRGRLWFDPETGSIVGGRGDAPRLNAYWAVRGATVEALSRLGEDGGADASRMPEALDGLDERTLLGANRLLASYLREVLGRDVPAARWLVGAGEGGRR
ncbi:MAG: DNA repair protein RecO [Phycisphaerales bacterium]